MWARDPVHAIVEPSVAGTRNLLEAAAHAGIEKVLYVSTTGTVGIATSPDRTLDESSYDERAAHLVLKGSVSPQKTPSVGNRKAPPASR